MKITKKNSIKKFERFEKLIIKDMIRNRKCVAFRYLKRLLEWVRFEKRLCEYDLLDHNDAMTFSSVAELFASLYTLP